MYRNIMKEAIPVLIFLLVATALIGISGIDLKIASYWYIDGGWPVGQLPFWRFFYDLNRMPAFAVALFGLGALLARFVRPSLKHWSRRGDFLILIVLLGPGLLVNTVFKDHWGRPRPREVQQFGGERISQHPWQPGISGKGKSFPSGHVAAAFVTVAPYFVYRREKKKVARIWLAGGIVFGMLMGAARILQGGHFLSDVLWACGMVYLCGIVLAAWLKPDQEFPVSAKPVEE